MTDRTRPSLAIFTEPVSRQTRLRHALSAAVDQLLGRTCPSPMAVGGHYGVTRSLLTGLERLGVPFSYNHDDPSQAKADVAVVLSSPHVLRQACTGKREGRFRRLFAGPNIVVLPGDADGVLLSPEIDRIIVPSPWVSDLYIANGPLAPASIAVWPAGVDETWWAPRGGKDNKRIVIYDKGMPELAAKVASLAEALGMQHTVIRYGSYSPRSFRAALDGAIACVVLTESESQGLALAEAWAMDVPTLVLDRRNRIIEGVMMDSSTAPYLCDRTGALWEDNNQLRELLLGLPDTRHAPRDWVLANMTDAVCARKFLKVVSDAHD